MNRQRGVTMVELLVSLAVVMIIIGAAATAYIKLLGTYKTQGRLAETYMANLTGLELLRYDIEMAGFGLPANMNGNNYTEAVADGAAPYNPTALNDAPANAPRTFVLGVGAQTLSKNNAGALVNSSVLAIKSSAANVFNNPTGRKWSMITNAGANPVVKQWGVTALDPVMDFTAGDRFIVLNNTGTLQVAAGGWCNTFNTATAGAGYYLNAAAIGTPNNQQVYYIYGLDNSNGTHNMPFNRVDYYLDNSIAADIPSSCAAGTFTLYRSTINQADGKLNKNPLIDCVEDFQVAFGLDTERRRSTNPVAK